jgi:integrase
VTKTAKADRLAAGWLLTLRGLRRSEVLGLTWADVDLEGGLLHVRHGRTGPGATLTPPKSVNSERSLPMDADLVAALRAWRTVLAGTYGTQAVAKTAFVVVDEAGRPMRPDTYSVLWRQVCHQAGIRRRVRTHEARHTFVTHLRDQAAALGLTDRDIATWAGHDEDTMRTTYDKRRQVNRGQQRVADAIHRLGEGA